MKKLSGLKALITGSNRGIGAGVAIAFAKEGADIAINYPSEDYADEAEVLCKTIKEIGSNAIKIQADVSNNVEVENMINHTIESFGHIDILVNSAGVIGAVDFENTGSPSLEDWDATYSVNVKGTAIVSEEVAKFMKIKNYGKIINISSHAAKYPNPDNTAYGASKAAVISLTQSLAAKLAKNNINVNVICPGSIWTPMWKKNAEKMILKNKSNLTPREVFLKFIKDNCPLQREQTVEDIGYGVAFFASDNSKNITGQSLNINGGTIMD